MGDYVREYYGVIKGILGLEFRLWLMCSLGTGSEVVEGAAAIIEASWHQQDDAW